MPTQILLTVCSAIRCVNLWSQILGILEVLIIDLIHDFVESEKVSADKLADLSRLMHAFYDFLALDLFLDRALVAFVSSKFLDGLLALAQCHRFD